MLEIRLSEITSNCGVMLRYQRLYYVCLTTNLLAMSAYLALSRTNLCFSSSRKACAFSSRELK